jgi:hypothetical protein
VSASHRSSSSVTQLAPSGGLTVPKPVGTDDRDVLIVQIQSSGALTNVVAPPGWDLLDSRAFGSRERWIWTRLAGVGEPASYVWTWNSASVTTTAVAECVKNAVYSIRDWDAAVGNNLSPASPSIDVLDDDFILWLNACGLTSGTATTEPAGYTERIEVGDMNGEIATISATADGATGVKTGSMSTSTDWCATHIALAGFTEGQGTLQGVATITPEPNILAGGDALLQGVAAFTPDAQILHGGLVTLQGIARVTSEADAVPRLDFTTYDAYLEAGGEIKGLVFYDEQRPETVSRRLEPTRTDVGNNPDEIRPDFGNFFAQSDFSHGAGQTYFHQPGRDPKKVFYLEGFDISEPGRLTHLHALDDAVLSASIGAATQVGDVPIVAAGTGVKVGNGIFPGTWGDEDPSGADGDVTVNDIIAEGARAFAALATATASVRVRSAAGAWSRYQPDGSTDLNVGTATRLAWIKSRLMVVGGTNGRSIYEIAASSTPTAIEVLPEGWAFEHIFEAGGLIHACAVNAAAGLSRVHHYGLNTAGSLIEKKSSTPWPQGQLMYVGAGFPGLAFIAGGKRNSSGGYDPILYRATMNELGEMNYVEIREDKGAGASDLSVRAITTLGETVLVGWSLGSGAFSGARDGIAIYHIARDAFALHLRKTGGGASQRVRSIMPYKGRVLVSFTGDGLYYEDLATFVPTATLVTSLADWNNAGRKVWDLVEVSHDPLAAGTSFLVEYDTVAQELASWDPVILSSALGSEGGSGRLSNVRSRVFALKITSTASASASPSFLGYSARSLPAPALAEFQLTRYIRLLAKDQKDEDAQPLSQNPRELLSFLQDALYSFVKFYESGTTWTAWLEDASTVEPSQPFYETTSGEALRDAYVVRLQLTGTK